MLTVGREHCQALKCQFKAGLGADLPGAIVVARLRCIDLVLQRVRKSMQPANPRGKAAQALKVLDDHGQRAQDGRKRACGLDCTADFQFAGQDIVGNDHGGQHDGQKTMGVLKQVELELPAQHLLVVGVGRRKDTLQRRHFARLAIVKGNRFGMFAHPHQAKAKVGFALQLAKVQANQPLAKHRAREHGGQCRIGD